MQYNYSFVIPHKNCPSLLLRLLRSIPKRDDVQVIVVDDNSNVVIDWNEITNSASNVEIVNLNTAESNGAGRARNEGMKFAKGEWLLFADSDDFYKEGFLNVLDRYKESDSLDILFFSCEGVDSDNLQPCSNADGVKRVIENYDGTKESLEMVKYRTHAPWCKMLRRRFVEKYGILYEEVPKGNDVKFSYLTSYFARSIMVIKDVLYVYTLNSQGITKSMRSIEGSLSICQLQAKRFCFFKYLGMPHLYKKIPFYNTCLSVLKYQGFCSFLKFCTIYLFQHKKIFAEKEAYVTALESIKSMSENMNGMDA